MPTPLMPTPPGALRPSCRASPLAAAFLLLFLAASSCFAETLQLARPPTGFVVLPASRSPGGVSAVESGKPPGTWRFAQWNNPDPAQGVRVACQDGALAYEAGSTSVQFRARTGEPCEPGRQQDASGRTTIAIVQSGAGLPCGRERPLEFDALVAPTRASINGAAARAPLASLKAVRERIAFRPVEAKVAGDGCRVNRSAAITALVLSNRASRQTFFYHLALYRFGTPPFRQATLWWATGLRGAGEWRSTNGNRRYGFGDSLGSYGQAAPETGRWLELDIDVLDRLKALIREGERFGMDQDLEKWTVAHAYHGHALWGAAEFSTEWRDFEVTFTR